MPNDAGLDTVVGAALSPIPVEPPQDIYRFLDRPEAPPEAPPAATNPAAAPVGYYPAFEVNQVRRDFPILSERVNGKPLIWLDNAATTQKPQAVLDPSWTGWRISTGTRTPTSTARPMNWRHGRPTPTKAREEPLPAFSAPDHTTTSSSSEGRPRPSTWWPRAGERRTSTAVTRSSSRTWSTTRTSN
jgi:hypothetical protein